MPVPESDMDRIVHFVFISSCADLYRYIQILCGFYIEWQHLAVYSGKRGYDIENKVQSDDG